MKNELRTAMAAVPDFDEEEGPLESPAPARQPSQVYSVRLPVERLDHLRRLAEEWGMQPTGLIRQWVLERLDVESGASPSHALVDRVIELEAQLHEQKKAIEQQMARYDKDIKDLFETAVERTLSVILTKYDLHEKKGV